jgi:hypothetical protein
MRITKMAIGIIPQVDIELPDLLSALAAYDFVYFFETSLASITKSEQSFT